MEFFGFQYSGKRNNRMLNRLEMLRVFSVVAEASSFKDAAMRLAMSPQKITRIVQELEKITGEVLFHRNTRSIRITEFGEQFHLRVKDVVSNVDDLFNREDPKLSELSGKVRITVARSLGRNYLVKIMKPLIAKYPEIILDVRATDSISDLVGEKIDIGIRAGILKDSHFIARSVATIDFKIVGTPALIKKYGRPKTIEDLNRVPTTQLMNERTGKPWAWNLNGLDFTPERPALITNDTDVELTAIFSGLGFGQTGGPMVRAHLKSGKLVEVLSDHTTDTWTLYVYRPQRSAVPKRVRLVFDHLVKSLSDPNIYSSP